VKAIPTAIRDVLVIEPRVFGDARGFFFESWNRRAFAEAVGLAFEALKDVVRGVAGGRRGRRGGDRPGAGTAKEHQFDAGVRRRLLP